MNLALSPSGERIVAFPGERAKCPSCNDEVIAKCGEIKQWHWAHAGREDCDPWSEPESEWHLGWKAAFKEAQREIVIGPHRADLLTESGTVIELQHSAISPEVIKDREAFYGKMIWVIDSAPFMANLMYYPKSGYVKMKWKWPRKSWLVAQKPIFIDTRDGWLFQPIKISERGTGYGHFIEVSEFMEEYGAMSVATPRLYPRFCNECGRNGVHDCFCQLCGEIQ